MLLAPEGADYDFEISDGSDAETRLKGTGALIGHFISNVLFLILPWSDADNVRLPRPIFDHWFVIFVGRKIGVVPTK